MADYTLDIRGMSCKGCEQIVRSELTGLSGVGDAEADADANEVRVYGDPATEPLARQAVLDAGYDLAE